MTDTNESEGEAQLPAEIGDVVGDFLGDAVTNVPAPVRKNLFKALNRLTTAAVDIGVANLEGRAEMSRARTRLRIELMEEGAGELKQLMEMHPEYAQLASEQIGARLLSEQANVDRVVARAGKRLATARIGDQMDDVAEIDDDWLLAFRREASQRTSEEMQEAFAAILEGQVIGGTTYSIKAVRALGDMDREIAELFRKFCSLCSWIELDGEILDARVVSLGKDAGKNGLLEFGFPFDTLNRLLEYGLIIADFNSSMGFGPCVVNVNNVKGVASFNHDGRQWVLRTEERETGETFGVSGVALSLVGKQLFRVVDKDSNADYLAKLQEYFWGQKLEMVEVVDGRFNLRD